MFEATVKASIWLVLLATLVVVRGHADQGHEEVSQVLENRERDLSNNVTAIDPETVTSAGFNLTVAEVAAPWAGQDLNESSDTSGDSGDAANLPDTTLDIGG